MMFPGPGAQVYYNDAGEPLGWDYPSYDDEPYDDYDRNYEREIDDLYCDYCEVEGHTFRTCKARDDEREEEF